jgi:hypothetical protein
MSSPFQTSSWGKDRVSFSPLRVCALTSRRARQRRQSPVLPSPVQHTADDEMPPKKRSRDDAAGQRAAEEDAKEKAVCDSINNAVKSSVNASVGAAFKELNEERERAEAERAQLLAEATEAAAKVTEEAKRAAEAEAEEITRKARAGYAALEAEKAAMEKAHTFQTNKICLDVGGHKFTTSRQTLTSVPDTYLSAMFSGRFALAPDAADGSYFLDPNGTHFRHVLRDPVSSKLSDMTETQKSELEVEVRFYGLLDYMMPEPESGPYAAQFRFTTVYLLAASKPRPCWARGRASRPSRGRSRQLPNTPLLPPPRKIRARSRERRLRRHHPSRGSDGRGYLQGATRIWRKKGTRTRTPSRWR